MDAIVYPTIRQQVRVVQPAQRRLIDATRHQLVRVLREL